MVRVLRHQLYCPGQHIIKQGEWGEWHMRACARGPSRVSLTLALPVHVRDASGRELYLVSVGYVDVVNEKTGTLLGPRLGPGSHFGEIGLLFHVNRTASVIVRSCAASVDAPSLSYMPRLSLCQSRRSGG